MRGRGREERQARFIKMCVCFVCSHKRGEEKYNYMSGFYSFISPWEGGYPLTDPFLCVCWFLDTKKQTLT